MSKNIGILGGGQLAKMMTKTAKEMNYNVYVLDPTPNCPAAWAGAIQMIGSFTKAKNIDTFVNKYEIDILTYDIESVNVNDLKGCNIFGTVNVHPNPSVLGMIQNKWKQHKFYQEAGLPIPKFESVNSFFLPFENNFVLKTRKGGYDGKGVWLINSAEEFNNVIKESGLNCTDFYAEEKVKIKKELALIMSTDRDTEISFYPIVELNQKDGICISTTAPANISKVLEEKIKMLGENIYKKIIEKYNSYQGILTVELFLTMDDEILINEMSPRVHNSGHYTIEGCITSQFTNHIRTIMGLSSGDCSLINPDSKVKMTNILGGVNEDVISKLHNGFVQCNCYFHWYNKTPKDGEGKSYRTLRKLGHYTQILNNTYKNIENNKQNNLVYVVMGSSSDLPQMKGCIELLQKYNIPFKVDIVSAHRTAKWMYQFAESAEETGRVIIAAAGGAAHLPGMIASISNLPVIGVPIETKALGGKDSLYSIVQMPDGVPVATVGIGKSKNAAILAIKIMGLIDISKQIQKENREKVDKQRKEHVNNFLKLINI